MSMPGIERYPDLLQRYREKIADAKCARGMECVQCEVNKVNARFRVLLKERLARDKTLRRG